MNIKPCPACDSDYDGDWSHGTAGSQLVCGNPGCKLCGPCGIDMEDAEKRWNAMPRRGDGLAWRSEPPDRTGVWCYTTHEGGDNFYFAHVDDRYINEGASLYLKGSVEFWCGPIPEPPATATEKEAAK